MFMLSARSTESREMVQMANRDADAWQHHAKTHSSYRPHRRLGYLYNLHFALCL